VFIRVCSQFMLLSYNGQKLDELQQHIDAMRVSCDKAESQLALTTGSSKTLLERAGNLREERFARIIVLSAIF
jgi:hypothetical protein